MVEVGKLSSDEVDVLASRGRVLASNHYGKRRALGGCRESTALRRSRLFLLSSFSPFPPCPRALGPSSSLSIAPSATACARGMQGGRSGLKLASAKSVHATLHCWENGLVLYNRVSAVPCHLGNGDSTDAQLHAAAQGLVQ